MQSDRTKLLYISDESNPNPYKKKKINPQNTRLSFLQLTLQKELSNILVCCLGNIYIVAIIQIACELNDCEKYDVTLNTLHALQY